MYKRENVRNIDNEVIKLIITDQTFLDVLLIKMRGRSIPFAAFKKKKEIDKKEKVLNRSPQLGTKLNRT